MLKYLAGSTTVGIVYRKTEDPTGSIFYTDADWSGCSVASMGNHTPATLLYSAITWKSHKQITIALYSTEAQRFSLAEAANDTVIYEVC